MNTYLVFFLVAIAPGIAAAAGAMAGAHWAVTAFIRAAKKANEES